MTGKTIGTAPKRAARGVRYGTQTRIVVAFDDDTFDALAALAKKRNCSFAEIVRECCDWRLEDL